MRNPFRASRTRERLTRVIGVGNPGCGDDGAGRAVARRLRALRAPGCDVQECGGDAASLMAAWEGARELVVVDACRGPGPPGRVHVVEARDLQPGTTIAWPSSHSFGVLEAIGLARALGRLPDRLLLCAIEGQDFAVESGLTPQVEAAVDRVAVALAAACCHGGVHRV